MQNNKILHATSIFAASVLLASTPWTFAETTTNKSSGQVNVGFIVEDFNWREELDNGISLEESGPLFGISLDGNAPLSPASPWKLYFRAEIYAGSVDYDGFLISIDGDVEPYKSDTFYLGTVGDLDMSYDLLPSNSTELRPFAGLGSRYWLRSLDDDGGVGYDEYWLTMYARLGARVHYHKNESTEFYVVAALVAPFYNNEIAVDVPLADGDIELEPKEETGLYVEAGCNLRTLGIAVFYEQLNFGESDLDDSGNFFQPESEMELLGLRVSIPL